MYSLSDALAVPTVGRVPRLCETLVGTQRFRKVGVEPTTLSQTGQEVMQLRRQAVFFTAAPCPLQRPSVAVTYENEEFHSMQTAKGSTNRGVHITWRLEAVRIDLVTFSSESFTWATDLATQSFLHVQEVAVFIQDHDPDYFEVTVVLLNYFRQLLLKHLKLFTFSSFPVHYLKS
jgi:hypothetical protein